MPTITDHARQLDLIQRLDRLDRQIAADLAIKPALGQKGRRDDLLARRLRLQDELDAFTAAMEKRYGPAAGQVFDRAVIQKAIPPAGPARRSPTRPPTTGPPSSSPATPIDCLPGLTSPACRFTSGAGRVKRWHVCCT